MSLCEFRIMHHKPTHLAIPPYLACALVTYPHPPLKYHWNPANQKPHLTAKAAVCHSVSHGVTLYPYSFTCKHSLEWIAGLVRGLWLLPPCQHWIPTGTLLAHTFVSQHHGDPAALGLWGWLFYMLQQLIDGTDIGLNSNPRIWAWGGSWVGQPSGSPMALPPGPALLCCTGEVQGSSPEYSSRRGAGLYF